MPFAQWHYPFENKEKFEARFPANFISEAIDQTRGWFYTLIAISTLIFGKAPFQNCVVLGHVQDKDGRKMSKHLGNVVDPKVVLEKQGADAIRWFFYSSSAPWLPCRFHEDALNEGPRKFMTTLWNTYYFYVLYADIDGFDPTQYDLKKAKLTLMDRWVLSRLNTVIKGVDEDLTAYRITESKKSVCDSCECHCQRIGYGSACSQILYCCLYFNQCYFHVSLPSASITVFAICNAKIISFAVRLSCSVTSGVGLSSILA